MSTKTSTDAKQLLLQATAESNRLGYYQELIDTKTVELRAFVDGYTGELANVSASIVTETPEQARELAARFPKSLRVRASNLSGADYYDHEVQDDRYRSHHAGSDGVHSHGWTVGYIRFDVQLTADGVNGGVNETGLRRLKSFRKHAERLGLSIEFPTRNRAGNQVKSEAELEALLSR